VCLGVCPREVGELTASRSPLAFEAFRQLLTPARGVVGRFVLCLLRCLVLLVRASHRSSGRHFIRACSCGFGLFVFGFDPGFLRPCESCRHRCFVSACVVDVDAVPAST
jgi:hypothetical protein